MKPSMQSPPRITLYLILPTFFQSFFLLMSSLSLAVQYDTHAYEHLLTEANSKGYIRVLISLDDTVTLEDMESKRTAPNL